MGAAKRSTTSRAGTAKRSASKRAGTAKRSVAAKKGAAKRSGSRSRRTSTSKSPVARIGRVASGIVEQAKEGAQAITHTVTDGLKSAASVIPGIGGSSSS